MIIKKQYLYKLPRRSGTPSKFEGDILAAFQLIPSVKTDGNLYRQGTALSLTFKLLNS
jgi:hypothetical protein